MGTGFSNCNLLSLERFYCKKTKPTKETTTVHPRKDKSLWRRINKSQIEKLQTEDLNHESGLRQTLVVNQNGIIAEDLKFAFVENALGIKKL